MLKRLTVLLLLLITLAVPGCAKNKPDVLDYQSKLFTAEASMKVNGEDYSVTIEKTGEEQYRLSFTAPEQISGVSIEKNGQELYFSSGNVHIPLKDNTNITADTLKLFDLSGKDMYSATEEMLSGVKTEASSFKCSYGDVKLYVSKETRLPVLIEADIKGNGVTLSFSNFKTDNKE